MMTTLLLTETEMTMESRLQDFFAWEMDGQLYSSLLVMLILLILGAIVGIKARKVLREGTYMEAPKGILFFAEWLVEFVQKFVKANMGDDPLREKWEGYLFGLFCYLFTAFLWGLTGMPSIIDWLAGPLCLSIIMFVLIQATALRYQHTKYFHRYIEPFAVFLPINLVTMWAPIISTTMRLFGNAVSGTIIAGLLQYVLGNVSGMIFGNLTTVAIQNYWPTWDVVQGGMHGGYVWTQIFLAPWIIGPLNLYFGLFSAYVQTLVFVSLNALWISAEIPEYSDYLKVKGIQSGAQ